MSKAHEALKEGDIGKIVKIQKFKRIPGDPDKLDYDSLEAFSGKLIGFSTGSGGARIYLEGFPTYIEIQDKRHYVEVWDHDSSSKPGQIYVERKKQSK